MKPRSDSRNVSFLPLSFSLLVVEKIIVEKIIVEIPCTEGCFLRKGRANDQFWKGGQLTRCRGKHSSSCLSLTAVNDRVDVEDTAGGFRLRNGGFVSRSFHRYARNINVVTSAEKFMPGNLCKIDRSSSLQFERIVRGKIDSLGWWKNATAMESLFTAVIDDIEAALSSYRWSDVTFDYTASLYSKLKSCNYQTGVRARALKYLLYRSTQCPSSSTQAPRSVIRAGCIT